MLEHGSEADMFIVVLEGGTPREGGLGRKERREGKAKGGRREGT